MTQERVESEGFYEMLWDCAFCGTKGLLGKSQRHCAECGGPQDPSKRYFPTPEQQQQVVGHTYEGADRACPACKAPMGAKAKNCTQCGSPLDGAREVAGVEKPPAPRNKRRIWPYIVAGLAVLGVAIWALFIRTHSAQLTIASHRWERTIAIEEFSEHSQSAWRDQVPADASFPSCFRKERSSRQVPSGEDCHTERHDKKDGTFEQVKKCVTKYRSEPIDDDWCTFTVRRWMKSDQLEAHGTGTEAAWPATTLPADVPATLGARRAGARAEKLTLDLGGDQTCEVSAETWRKYSDGQKVKVEVRARSGDVVCSSL